ncbi:MAG: AraC family transcriptional regulator [Fibrobacteres bacterium]|nr:AraC family transcriptional regulator [Fibrobacterota bacterium]
MKNVDKIIKIAHPGLLSSSIFSDLSICIGGYYEKAAGHYCKRTAVTEYQVAYCVGGKGFIRCAGREYPVESGSVFINIPGHAHEYWADEKDPWTHYWVHFVGTSAARYFEFMNCKPEEPGFFIGQNDHLVELYRVMLEQLKQENHVHHLQAVAILHNILSHIAVLRNSQDNKSEANINGQRINMRLIDDYIAKHLKYVTLQDLAVISSLSIPHFIRLFKNANGVTPVQYVINKRINAARRLIVEDSTLNIKQAAMLCGYDDQHYFSRQFTKVTGMNPNDYRRMIRR